MKKLIILGGGNYGYVAREIAYSTNEYSKIDFLDDNNIEAIGKFEDYTKFTGDYESAFVALGNPEIRKLWTFKLKEAGFSIETIVSPQSYVSSNTIISEGSLIEPMAVVHNEAKIGMGVLVCAGAVVNHNSEIKDFCQIDCGAVVGAGAVVEEKTKINYNQAVYKK